jgi:hypothetical protein
MRTNLLRIERALLKVVAMEQARIKEIKRDREQQRRAMADYARRAKEYDRRLAKKKILDTELVVLQEAVKAFAKQLHAMSRQIELATKMLARTQPPQRINARNPLP